MVFFYYNTKGKKNLYIASIEIKIQLAANMHVKAG